MIIRDNLTIMGENINIIDDIPRCPRCKQPRFPDPYWPDKGDLHCGFCGYIIYGVEPEKRTTFQDHVGYRKVRV